MKGKQCAIPFAPLRLLARSLGRRHAPPCTSAAARRSPIRQTPRKRPIQRAYALLASYAALVETATGIIREPNVPVEAKRALGRAEAVATPAVHTLEAAFAAYLRTRSAFEASAEADQSGVSRAAAALSAASQALSDAIEAARAPIADLQALVEAPKH